SQRSGRRGDDARSWIQWGHILVEHGHNKRADTAYARAAELSPDNPTQFLASGWWVVGPYDEQMEVLCPPELGDTDPTKLLPGEVDMPYQWKILPINADFYCDLKPISVRERASAYALAHVYSPREQGRLMSVWCDDKARVWLNGALVFDSESHLVPSRS